MAKFTFFKGTPVGGTHVKRRKGRLKGEKGTRAAAQLFSASYSGQKGVAANLKELKERFPGAFAVALFEEAVRIMEISVKERVPRDTNLLAASARVKPPKTSIRPTVVMDYNTPYALKQHEKHFSKAKYLENPVKEAQPKILSNLAIGTIVNANRKRGVSQLKEWKPKGIKVKPKSERKWRGQ